MTAPSSKKKLVSMVLVCGLVIPLSGCWKWYALNAGLQIAQLVIPPTVDVVKEAYHSYANRDGTVLSIASSWSQSVSNTDVCRLATENDARIWKTDFSASEHLAEARMRNLSLEDCALLLRYSSPATSARQAAAPDTSPPILTIISGSTTDSDEYRLSGTVSDETQVAALTVDGVGISVDRSGAFEVPFYIPNSGRRFEVVVIDAHNNRATRNLEVTRKLGSVGEIPHLEPLDPLKVSVPLKPNAYALIIGLEEYDNLPKADFADRDAQYFAGYAHRALGVKKTNIKTLINAQASRNAIMRALKLWLPAHANNDDAEVFLFFAGHGLAAEDGRRLFLLPADTETALLEDTAINLDDIIRSVAANRPISATLFLDTCYSGLSRSGRSLKEGTRGLRVVSKTDALPPNFQILSASSGSQTAISLPEVRHGLFSYFLMKSLEGAADYNRDGRITIEEIHRYTVAEAFRHSIRLGSKQVPSLTGNFGGAALPTSG